LALQQQIDIIDKDYRGNVGVVVFNHAENPFVIPHGEQIATLTCHKRYYPKIEEVDTLKINM
jgi:dUTPase